MTNVYIIGSKGIPSNYGGFETFVDKLTENKKSSDIKYHVACLAKDDKEFTYNNARCFNVNVPDLGSARAVLYDIMALKKCVEHIKLNKSENPIIYILACRIGPFLNQFKKSLKNQGVKVYINPDGHEWKRSKWNAAIKRYWKYSERLMVKNADLLICDSIAIEKYIKEDYKKYNPKTTFIAYGADINTKESSGDNSKLKEWYSKFNIEENQYYLIVGRFVPENNYETAIREFMTTDSKKDLVIISNVEENKFFSSLKENTNFTQDKRVKFVGTVYDQELLANIREEAFAYIHGHEVGGTNPSLLEALATTKLNLLLNVAFNKEVAQSAAVYFDKTPGSLKSVIEEVEAFDEETLQQYGEKAKQRIETDYSWDKIVNDYEKTFLKAGER
jgi:rhamnosyltransferase